MADKIRIKNGFKIRFASSYESVNFGPENKSLSLLW